MNTEFDDIIAEEQVSENFAFDSGESIDADLTLEEIDTPIKELKVIILSIDWEITPEILDKFQQEIKRLEDVLKQNNIALAFLRILSFLGNYIKICLASAHADAVKLLYSVYNGLEKIIVSKEMSEAAKVALVQAELSKYNAIRDAIKAANAQAAKGAAVSSQTADSSQIEEAQVSAVAAEQRGEEVTPALTDVSSSAEDQSRQWSFQDNQHQQDVVGRLSEFFGEDSAVEFEGGIPGDMEGSGVVPLGDSTEETADFSAPEQAVEAGSEPEPDMQPATPDDSGVARVSSEEEVSQRLDAFFGDDEGGAAGGDQFKESSERVVPLGDSTEEGADFSAPDQAVEAGSEPEPDMQSVTPDDSGAAGVSSEEEVSQRLDAFFVDEDGVSVGGEPTEADDGVVPLSTSSDERSSTHPEPASETESPDHQNVNIFDDLFSNKQGTPADDLLLQMHLPVDRKSSVEDFESELSAPEETSQEEDHLLDEQPANEGSFVDPDGEISQRLDDFLDEDEESEATPLQVEVEDGVVPLSSPLSMEPDETQEKETATVPEIEEPDSETRDLDSELTDFSQLKEIIAGLDASISTAESSDFSSAVKRVLEIHQDNKVVLMLLEAMKSSFSCIREANMVTPERTAMLCALCDMAAEAAAVPDLSDSRLTTVICEEMRKYIVSQDSTITALLANK